ILVKCEPAPTRALDTGGRGLKCGLELLNATKFTFNSFLQVTVADVTTAFFMRCKVLPEETVVDVTTAIELDLVLELDLLGEIASSRCIGELFLSFVQTFDVGSVVLVVMQRHDLLGDVRLKCIVGIREIGQDSL